VRADKEKVVEHWCTECDMGPFPSKRSLDGHIAKAHKYVKKDLRQGEASGNVDIARGTQKIA
jgi:hypothetical protein